MAQEPEQEREYDTVFHPKTPMAFTWKDVCGALLIVAALGFLLWLLGGR